MGNTVYSFAYFLYSLYLRYNQKYLIVPTGMNISAYNIVNI